MEVGERLATVEADVRAVKEDVTEVKADVTEIKGDVKTLLLTEASRSGGDRRLHGLVPVVALIVSVGAAVAAFVGR